jgi:hypothetical protein
VRLAGFVLAAALVAGCSTTSAVTSPDGMTLNVENGSTLQVTLVVNGQMVSPVDAGGALRDVPASQLPGLPWNAEVRSPSGRVLVSMVVHAGDVAEGQSGDGSGFARGRAARADLSCGRIDIWSGPPLLGPSTAGGSPGDCAP